MKTRESTLERKPSAMWKIRAELGLSAPGYIESWGCGIEKIRQECLAHGIEPPVYDSGMAGLMLSFHANPEHVAKAGEAAAGNSTDRVGAPEKTLGKTPAQILDLLGKHPNLTVPELAGQLSKSASAVQRGIFKLQQEGHLKRVGSRKSGHWEVTS